jgi:hypothetical protein
MATRSKVMDGNDDAPEQSVHRGRHQKNNRCYELGCMLEVDYLLEALNEDVAVISRVNAVEVDKNETTYTVEIVFPFGK